jgi:myosin heavy subunit
MSTETKETKLQEIEVLNAEQIKQLDEATQENIIFLSDNLHGSELVKLNPIVNTVMKLRAQVNNLKAEKKDGEVTKESIKEYKAVKADLRSLGGTITSEFKEMKAPYNKIGKGLVAIEKEFKRIKGELEEQAQSEFAEYEAEKKRKAEEAQAKKDAELKAAMEEANQQADAEREKRERSEAFNRVKYEFITEGIGEYAETAIEEQNEEALAATHSNIARREIEQLYAWVDSSLLTDEQKEDLEAHFNKVKARAIKAIEARFDEFEEQREAIRKEASMPPPPPPARNEDVAPADPDVPTGNIENKALPINLTGTTPERHAEKVWNYITGLHMSVKHRVENEGGHPALIDLLERFNKFNS